MKPRRWLTSLALLAALGGFLALVFSVARHPIDISPIAASNPTGRQPPRETGASPLVPGLESFPETLHRPLFSKTRRPFVPVPEPAPMQADVEPPAEPAEAPPSQPPDLTLRGIAIEGSSRKALIMSTADPKGIWMGLGERIENWTISGIGREDVILRSEDQELILNLYVENPRR